MTTPNFTDYQPIPPDDFYDVIVVGAGHAGCESALAAARMGCRTLVLTGNPETIALMPCNPSIGGPAKGHVVREIDALGGEMGRAIDRSFIQIRLLNTGKGPAVQALRAQADKTLYSRLMRETLEREPNLTVGQALVGAVEPLRDDSRARVAVITKDERRIRAGAVVVTTGTFLSGRLICGENITPGGRAGEAPAQGLSECLRGLGFRLGRLKTGTPPRVHAGSIRYDRTVLQPGSATPLYFSFDPSDEGARHFAGDPNPRYPRAEPTEWRPQLPCYLVHTNERTHQAIRDNLHRAPMFTGLIEGVGPRYCPSIEDKIVRFADKASHGLFLEPEGWLTDSVYVQGANTSLPEDVQDTLVHSIPALADAEILRYGYAVEYDFVLPSQTFRTLEAKLVPGLYFAGQINGTSGYEEAAGQGIVAGINAALRATGGRVRRPDLSPATGDRPGTESLADALASIRETGQLVLPRALSYIGVMVDDLTTSSLTEPYRLFTSRAEYRLLLRQDNADLRLTPIGYALGLISPERYAAVERKRAQIGAARRALAERKLTPSAETNARLTAAGLPPIEVTTLAEDLAKRVDLTAAGAQALSGRELSREAAEQVALEIKYEGYLRKQSADIEHARKLEHQPIPADFDYAGIRALRNEARQKFLEFQPLTVGQASRLYGITPADIALLLVHLRRA